MKEKNQLITAENFQQWAELCSIDYSTYSIEVSSPDAYFRDYVNYPPINYWEWFVIPSELTFKPASQIIFKPRVLKQTNFKTKPLLFCNRTIIPLRI